MMATGMLMANAEPHQKCSTSHPPSTRPSAPPPPAMPRPDGDGLGPLVRREAVDEDAQRRRHDQRAADAHHRTSGDDSAAESAKKVA